MKKMMIVTTAVLFSTAVLTGSVIDKKITKDITWKTEKAESGYITHFYNDGKYNCSVKTANKIPVYINKNPENIVFRKNEYILVEKVHGICTNLKGDGKDRQGNYISYRNVKNFRKGKYTTYLIYENDNSTDNVIGRIDCRS